MSVTEAEEVTGARLAPELRGHEGAVATLTSAMASGRMPHAWLFSGPKGIGKASLAYRLAYNILAGGMDDATEDLFGAGTPAGLELDRESAVIRRAIAGGHADFMVLERQWDEKAKRLRNEIVIDDVRRLQHFFAMTPAEGGWRVAIIDSADEMNQNAANALLKVLEEPPARAILILISHAPGKLLPTIISRCRRLTLRPLPDHDVEELLAKWDPGMSNERAKLLSALVDGSPGRAEQLMDGDALDFFEALMALVSDLPAVDIPRLHALADKLNRRGKEEASEIALEALLSWLQRAIREAASKDCNASESLTGIRLPAHLTDDPATLEQWIEVWENMQNLMARTRALNLDRKQMIVQMIQWMAECGAKAA